MKLLADSVFGRYVRNVRLENGWSFPGINDVNLALYYVASNHERLGIHETEKIELVLEGKIFAFSLEELNH